MIAAARTTTATSTDTVSRPRIQQLRMQSTVTTATMVSVLSTVAIRLNPNSHLLLQSRYATHSVYAQIQPAPSQPPIQQRIASCALTHCAVTIHSNRALPAHSLLCKHHSIHQRTAVCALTLAQSPFTASLHTSACAHRLRSPLRTLPSVCTHPCALIIPPALTLHSRLRRYTLLPTVTSEFLLHFGHETDRLLGNGQLQALPVSDTAAHRRWLEIGMRENLAQAIREASAATKATAVERTE